MVAPLAPAAGGPGPEPTSPPPPRPVVVSYRADWPERAATTIAVLADVLGTPAHRIEHIGSTAIAGMAAKDVIDLQVSVGGLDIAARAFHDPLVALGFERSPYQQDHIPAGRFDDPARWEKRLWFRRGPRRGPGAGGLARFWVSGRPLARQPRSRAGFVPGSPTRPDPRVDVRDGRRSPPR